MGPSRANSSLMLAGLESLLAHDVELTGDGGGKVPAQARTMQGRSRVASAVARAIPVLTGFPDASWHSVEVNGGPGAIFLDGGQQVIGVMALDIVGNQITGIQGVVNPDKLAHLGPVADLNSLIKSARTD